MKHKDTNISRRMFLKETALVSTIGAGLLVGCSPKVVSETQSATGTAQPALVEGQMNAAMAAQKWSFEIPPEPILDKEIASTVTADVIVVGAGTSGLVCANSAVENGAKVVVITASKGNISRGGSNHAMNSKLLRKSNVILPDTDKFLRKEIAASGYTIDQDKWWKYATYSEEAMDWLIDKMEAAGFQTVLEKSYEEPNNGPMTGPIGSHSWITKEMPMAGAGQQFVVDTLAKTAQAAGAQIFYKMVAKQLVRGNNNTGRVEAVIAQGEDGKYTKYVGTKAIVLATGDFSADKEMMAKYCPQALPLVNVPRAVDQGYDTTMSATGLFPGDGQKMALWIGASWQKTYPNCPMIAGGVGPATRQPSGNFQGLVVNKNGLRCGNEDTFGGYSGIVQMRQPEMKVYAIWDASFANAMAPWFAFGAREGDEPIDPVQVQKEWDKSVENKAYVKGNSIDEVLSQLDLPATETKATIDRYNQSAAKGVDEDFFKRKELMVPISTSPFYGAVSSAPMFLTVLGGLRTNLDMQVCDSNDQPIPGLFNVGTMVGDYFSNVYNFLTFGHNLGANCVTFGYLTGKFIANN